MTPIDAKRIVATGSVYPNHLQGDPDQILLMWFGQSRRPSKDDEQFCSTSEALIYATMIRLMRR